MLVLTLFNTFLLGFTLVKVVHVEKQVIEANGTLDGVRRLLVALFTKARKNRDSEVS